MTVPKALLVGVVFGAVNCGWLKALIASALNCNWVPSLISESLDEMLAGGIAVKTSVNVEPAVHHTLVFGHRNVVQTARKMALPSPGAAPL